MSFATDDTEDQAQGGTGLSSGPQQSQGQQNQNDVSLGGGGSATAGPTGGNVGGAGASQQPTAQQAQQESQPSASGSWTNLQSYLNANSDQASQEGQQIAGTVSGQATTAQNDVNQTSSDFQNQVNASTVKQDQSGVAKDISDAENATANPVNQAGGGSGTGSAPLTEAQQLAQDQANFQAQSGATYNGPTDFTQDAGYGQAQGALNTAGNSLSELGSESGRDVLLNNQYANASQNGYNQGETNLDQLLLAGGQGNAAGFQNVQNQFSGLSNALNAATTQGNTEAAQGAATDAATAAAAQGALSTANTNFQSGLQTDLTNAQNTYASANSGIQADLASGKLSAQDLASLGVTAGTNTYGLTGAQLAADVTAGNNPTLYNTATADQYAQSAALAGLGGTGAANFLPGSDASQAGTSGSPYSFNKSAFDSAAALQKSSLEQQILSSVTPNDLRTNVYGADPTVTLPAAEQFVQHDIANKGLLTNQSAIAQEKQWESIMNALNSNFGNLSGAPIPGGLTSGTAQTRNQ